MLDTTSIGTELDAVNLCLSGIGKQPVPSLDTSDLDVAQALTCINTSLVSLAVGTGEGWYFNNEPDWRLSPDPYNGQVIVPNNVMSIVCLKIGNESHTRDFTIRDDKLYHKKSHSYDVRPILGSDDSLNATFIMYLPFESLPIVARQAIAWQARTQFCWDVEGDPQKLKVNEMRAMDALDALTALHLKQMRYNNFNTPMMQEFMGGRYV